MPESELSVFDAEPRFPGVPEGNAPRAQPRTWPRSLGLPHLRASLAWTGGLVVAQMLAGLFVGLLGACAMLVHAGQIDLGRLNGSLLPLLLPVGTGTTLVVSLIVVRLAFGGEWPRRLALNPISTGQCILIVLAVPPLQILASAVSNGVRGLLPGTSTQWFDQFQELPWPLLLGAVCIAPGIGEEIFFRGFLSRGLMARHGILRGSLAAAFLFAIVHLDPVQSSGAFVLGLALQYLFLTTRSLYAPIVAHVLNNCLALWLMRHGDSFPIPGLNASEAVPQQTPWGLLILAAGVVVLLFGLLHRCRTRWVQHDGREWLPVYPTAEAPPPDVPYSAERRPLQPLGGLEWALALAYGCLACGLFSACAC